MHVPHPDVHEVSLSQQGLQSICSCDQRKQQFIQHISFTGLFVAVVQVLIE